MDNTVRSVIIFDPVNMINRRIYVFVGDAPTLIKKTLKSLTTENVSASKKKEYHTTLKNYYGKNYKKMLYLDIDNPEKYNIEREIVKRGGARDPNKQDASLDENIEALLKSPKFAKMNPTKEEKPKYAKFAKLDFEPGIEYVYDLDLYKEDNFMELREKIYTITDMPVYRQHIFYINYRRFITTHINIINNNTIDYPITKKKSKHKILDIPILKEIYDDRDSIRIYANDTFKIVKQAIDNVFYVVDLAQYIDSRRPQLLEMINDTYQFELFYYGFVILYWPQMTLEIFRDYILNESELHYKYPELAKDVLTLQSIYSAEKEIISDIRKNSIKAEAELKDKISTAITQLTASVKNKETLINIRNLFDYLKVSRIIPEIRAYIETNSRSYLLRKRHIRNASDIEFPSGGLMKTDLTIAISLKKEDQESFHKKKTKSTTENEQTRYLFINIRSSGTYYVRTMWNEEDKLNFTSALKLMKELVNPLIESINNLGRYVFIKGRLPLISKKTFNFKSINLCIFWKRLILESAFKTLKTLFEPYMRANIIGGRNVQQFDKYEILFKKGMYKYDPEAIDNILSASNNITLTNHYAYLSDHNVKQKWDQNYGGRIVRITHRTSDVKFEIEGLHMKEFNTFYTYILMFIYRALKNPKFKEQLNVGNSSSTLKKLRKLREQDPELFNLKKYGSNKVYSRLCMKPKQPVIYTEEELKSMSQNKRDKLVKYWNFTMNKPVYYGCPSKRYPYLGYLVGIHPKNYCLPCCNRNPHLGKNSKKQKIYQICQKNHIYLPINESSKDIARHILTYGKEIDIGRLAKIPNIVKKLINDPKSQTKSNYYIFGVSQHLPGVEHVGLIYSIAECLHKSLEELIEDVINALKQNRYTFNNLLNGSLCEYFNDIDDLINSMRDLFILKKIFDISNINKKIFNKWTELFTELFYLLFDLKIIVFLDSIGYGENVDLILSETLKSEMIYILGLSNKGQMLKNITQTHKYVLMMKKLNRYYPIFKITPDDYFKNYKVEKKIYSFSDNPIKIVYEMVNFERKNKFYKINKMIDLSLLQAFCENNSSYKIIKKYINRRNLCYAVLLKNNESCIYVPCDYSVHTSDNIETTFEVFDKLIDIKLSDVSLFITSINGFIKKKYKIGTDNRLFSYALMKITNIVYYDNEPYGATISTDDENYHLMFYITYNDLKNMPKKEITYDLNEINKLIMERAKPKEDKRNKLLFSALYENHLYQLFVIEFINYMISEKNEKKRNTIKNLILENGIHNSKTYKIIEIKIKSAEDIQKLFSLIYESSSKKGDIKSLFDKIDNIRFDFDNITLNALPKAIKDEKIKIINELAQKITTSEELPKEGDFPNIYIPCYNDSSANYCNNRKLIVPKNKLNNLIDLLIADLENPLKSKYLLDNVWVDAFIDYFKFIKRPTEIITIYRRQ